MSGKCLAFVLHSYRLWMTVLFACFCVQIYCNASLMQPKPRTFRAMTFNLWDCGIHVENGWLKIVRHIRKIDPDVIALQEISDQECLDNISRALGPKWSSVVQEGNSRREAIFTKHIIVPDTQTRTDRSIGCQIDVLLDRDRKIRMAVFSAHLQWKGYGPNAACSKLCTNEQMILDGENGKYLGETEKSRVQDINDILKNDLFALASKRFDEEPLVLMGDFNTPSHKDYTKETAKNHCGSVFQWPATQLIMDRATVVDAYRYVHRDPLESPGNTWPTITYGDDFAFPSQQDRIDFIFYHGYKLSPVSAQVYHGSEPINPKPNHWTNDWPSDHAAVVVEFELPKNT